MITTFWGTGDSEKWWGVFVLALLIIIGIIITLFWFKGPKYTRKITRYIPLSLALIIVGILLSGGGLYECPKWFSTALNITTDNQILMESKGWDISWTQEAYGSDMLRWGSLIGSSFLVFYAGFTIDIKLFKKYGLPAILISFLPIFFEGTFFALLITPILYSQQNVSWSEFNWAIPFFIGFAIAAASPGIVVPLLIKFEQMGYGKYNKINEIAIICGSVDSITSLGLMLVFFSLVLKVEVGNPEDNIGSTFIILFARIPVMIILSTIVGIASYLLFIFYIKIPLDKFVPHKTEIKGKTIKIWNILALIGLLTIIILINEMCQHAEEGALNNIFDKQNKGFSSWIFPNGFLAFLVMGILLSNVFHNDLTKNKKNKIQKENASTFMQWIPMVWLFIFAPLVFGNIGGLIIFTWIWQWVTLLYISIVIFCVVTGRSLGARIALYDQEKFKWNDVGVISIMSYPRGTTPAASTVFIGFLVYFSTQANSENSVLFAELMFPLFNICIAAIIVTIPTSELVFNFYFKHFMATSEKDKAPDPIPIPLFNKINVHFKKINSQYQEKYIQYKKKHFKK